MNRTVTSTISPGGDWVDLAPDQHTLLCTPESTRVGSVETNGTANPDFSTKVPTYADYALRILKNGDVLVADTDRVVELNSSGNVVNTFCLSTSCNAIGVSTLFALNILPGEKSFLTGDLSTGMIYQLSIGSGTLEPSFDGLHGQGGQLGGLAVFGEFQAGGGSGGGSDSPEPSTLILLGCGMMGLAVDEIQAVRRFNRFYTRAIGTLQDSSLYQPYSLAEARVLYEIGTEKRSGAQACEIADQLQLDEAYLSRILSKCEMSGLIAKEASPSDRRQNFLHLTAAGSKTLAELNVRSNQAVSTLLKPLSPSGRARLVEAMKAVETLLTCREE